MCLTPLEYGADSTAQTSVVGKSIARVRPLLDIVDKLRALGIENDIEIPQIAVIGDQSSGKSSVLEFLSGVPFPRGTGLVTRCATQVTMKKSKFSEWKGHAKVSWSDRQPEGAGKLDSPADVAGAIEKLTEALTAADASCHFSSHSIIIEIEAPNVPDLTVIDLPGIIRTTTQGQSQSVIKQVDNLLQKFLEQERTIILGVVPANVDIATVDVLERANECDPKGDRTIAVLTKLDLVDPGACSEVADVLQNLSKPIKLGYCAVKNRSAKDLKNGMALEEAKIAETEFFAAHPEFSKLDPSLFGIQNLTEKLVRILAGRIRAALPEMYTEINRGLMQTEDKLNKLGEKPPSSNAEQRTMYQKLMMQISRAFEQASKGDYNHSLFYGNEKDLLLYTRAHESFERLYHNISQKSLDFSTDQGKLLLHEKLEEYRGRDLSCFVPTRVFNSAVEELIKDWPLYSSFVCDEVVRTAQTAINLICEKLLSNYPDMQIKTANMAKEFISKLGAKASSSVKACISYEREPFTMNPKLFNQITQKRGAKYCKIVTDAAGFSEEKFSFCGTKSEIAEAFETLGSDDSTVDDLIQVVEEYYELAKSRYVDLVCMILRSEILDAAADSLPIEFLSISLDEDVLEQLFSIDISVKQTRANLEEKKKRLRSALHALNVAKLS